MAMRRRSVATIAAAICGPLSLLTATAFVGLAWARGGYPEVAVYGGAAWVVPDASGGAMNVQIPVIRQTAKEQLLTGSMANLAGGEGITVLHLHDNTGAALTTATAPVVRGETAYYDTGNAYTMTQGGAGTGPAGTAAYLGIAPDLAGIAVLVIHGTHQLVVETIAVGNALVVTHASLP